MATKRTPDTPSKNESLTGMAKKALSAAVTSVRGSQFKTRDDEGFSASFGAMPLVKAKPGSYSGKARKKAK